MVNLTGGTMQNKRQVIFRSNMFDPSQKEVSEVEESLSFREIYNSITYHPLSYAVIIDGDKKINLSEIDNIPESNNVMIKIHPGISIGGFTNWVKEETKDAFDVEWGDKGDMFQSFVFVATGGIGYYALRGLGVAFKYGMNKYIEYLANKMDNGASGASGVSPEQRPDLKGGSNRPRQMGRLPILLGKHLIFPDVAGLTYIDISSDGKDQYLYSLFCAGYKNISVDTATYKIGETALNSTYFPGYDLKLEQAGAALSLYPSRKIASSVSTEITVADGAVLKQTPTNTSAVEIFITFPRGLYESKDGAKVNATVNVKVEYKPSTGSTWYTVGNYIYTSSDNETLRYKVTKTFDNLTVSGADYCAARQYDIRLTRITPDNDSSAIVDSVTFDMMQSITGIFNGTTVDTTPVLASAAAGMTLFALKVKATANVNGTLETFNFVGQSKVPVYSGSGTGYAQWATVSASSNPAALFLYVLRDAYINKKPVANDYIDWPSFEAWYTYCSTMGFECNAYITNEIVIEELLNQIATTARASWSVIDGKFSIIIDKAQTTICQYFTPRNSWGFSATKNFDELSTGVRVSFINAASGYQSENRVIYADEDTPSDEKIDDCDLFGCTSSDEAWKRGRYILANIHLRRETFTFSCDVEHISCSRWDRIALSHDVCSVGLGYARIKTLRVSGSNVVGFEMDERVVFEPSHSYSVTIRLQDGSGTTYAVNNPATTVNVDTDEVTLTTPIVSGLEPFNVDDLLIFGETGSEVIDLIVTDISRSDDFSAKITCIPYVAALYTWDSGDIPTYDSKVSLPGDLENSVFVGIPIDPSEMAVRNESKIGETGNFETALTAIYDTLIEVADGTYYPAFPYFDYSLNLLLYTNLTDEGIWQTAANSVDKGTELNANAGYVSCNNLYVKSADGCIYDMSNNQKTYSESWCPQVNEAGDIIYVKLSDGGMYKKASVSGAITQIGSFTLKHFEIYYYGNQKVLIWDDGTISGSGTGAFILVDIDTGLYYSTIAAYLSEPVSFKMMDYDTLLYLDTDFNLHRIELADGNEDYLYIPDVLQFDCINNIIYYITPAGKMYKRFKDMAAAKIDSRPYIKTSLTSVTITGDGVSGENIISGISATDIGVIFTDDILSGTGIPENAKVLTIDTANSRILIDKKLTSSFSDQVIAVVTSRLQIDARTGIANESVTFYQLAPDAVENAIIKNGAVDNNKVATGYKLVSNNGSGEIKQAHIENGYKVISTNGNNTGEIKTAHIDGGAVTVDKIGIGAVEEIKIGKDAVTASKIKDGEVTSDKLETNIDLTGHTLVLPNSTTIAPTAEGSIGWDTDDNLLKIGDGSATKTMVDTNSSQSLTNKSLTNASLLGDTTVENLLMYAIGSEELKSWTVISDGTTGFNILKPCRVCVCASASVAISGTIIYPGAYRLRHTSGNNTVLLELLSTDGSLTSWSTISSSGTIVAGAIIRLICNYAEGMSVLDDTKIIS